MEEIFLILKLSCIAFILNLNLFAIEVLVSENPIGFEEKLDNSKIVIQNVSDIGKSCIPLTLNNLEKEEYIASHYINKNTIICVKDVKKYEAETIVFNFGGFKIEKKGKIIFENKEYIKIKNSDGTIEQIYKDGRIK